MVLRHLIEHLVEADANEVNKHQFYDRPEPRLRGADGHSDEGSLGDRGVEHSLVAELAGQAPGCPEYPAEVGHILAEDHHRVV